MTPKTPDDQQAWLNLLGTAVERLVEFSTTLKGNPTPEKNGGYLALVSYHDAALAYQREIGTVPQDKEVKYHYLAANKCLCLLANPGCVSTFPLINPDYGKYGMWAGAIRAISYLYGFSGLDQMLDEAVSTAAAYFMDDLTESDVKVIKRCSENPFIDRMLSFVDEVLRPELGSFGS